VCLCMCVCVCVCVRVRVCEKDLENSPRYAKTTVLIKMNQS